MECQNENKVFIYSIRRFMEPIRIWLNGVIRKMNI